MILSVIILLVASPALHAAEWRPVAADKLVDFVVLLKQKNLGELRQRFQETTTPGSKTYRQWMSASEVASLVAAPPEALSRTKKWLMLGGAECTGSLDALRCM